MPTKRTLEQVKERDYLKMSELAELNGVRYSTVKYYSELGLLPFEQKGQRLAKYYPRLKASERIKKILKLKERGDNIPKIVDHFISERGAK